MTVSLVQSITPSTTSAGSAASSGANSAGEFNAFLQLLLTELKNQDPTKPLDPTQTVTQLATFSSVEQAVKTNALLSQLADSSTLSQASALIGHTATSPDGSVTGVVESVTMIDGGLVANLKGGARLLLGSGVSIS